MSDSETVQLNVFLGGAWLHLGTATIRKDEDDNIVLLDYIPAKPLAEQRKESRNEVHEHLDARLSDESQGEDQPHEGLGSDDVARSSPEEGPILDRDDSDRQGDDHESERSGHVAG